MVDTDRHSAFSDPDSHPRDTATLSPWQWLPWTFILVVCVLFFSLRRARSLELYNQARDFIQDKLSMLNASIGRSVRLSISSPSDPQRRPRNTRLDSASEDEEDGPDRFYNDDDELPHAAVYRSPVKRLADGLSLASRGVAGWVMGRGDYGGHVRHAFGDTRSDGIARAFWGTGRARRTGGIRLGGSTDEVDTSNSVKGRGGLAGSALSGVQGLLSSVTDVLSGNGRPGPTKVTAPASSSARPRQAPLENTAPTALFDLGDDGDDAEELPGTVTLREAQRLAAQGPKSSFTGMQRL